MRFKILLGLILGTLLMTGCSGSTAPSQIRYSMVQDLDPAMLAMQEGVTLRLTPALNDGGIVLQVGSNTLREARFHRWAEPLDSQLKALTANALLSEHMSLKGQTLEVFVSRFQGSESGQVYVSAAFTLLDAKGHALARVSRSAQSAQEKPGYEALVSALRQNFDKICSEALRELK